jgi:hypothetical protein
MSATPTWTGATHQRAFSRHDLDVSRRVSATSARRRRCASPVSRWKSNFLATLGIVPAAGRDFRPEDDRPGAPKVALLSYSMWQSRFGGDPAAAGKTIRLDDGPVRVIGFLPRTFEMPQLGDADVLLAEQLDERVARAPQGPPSFCAPSLV